MAEVKHTPGPLIAVGSEVLKPLSDHSKLTLTVARCAGANEEAEANATLYAAAPDLFEALTRSAEGWANAVELGLIPPQHRDTARILRDEAWTALSKATAQQEGR